MVVVLTVILADVGLSENFVGHYIVQQRLELPFDTVKYP